MARRVQVAWWLALPLLVLAFPFALVTGLLGKRSKKTADEMVADMERFVGFAEGRADWDLDEFEAVPLADEGLEKLRREAVMAGPPNVDLPTLRRVLAEVRHIAADQRRILPDEM